MTVRVYRWDDASAPSLTGQSGSLISLLDAVLVNGYGSKPAAGWGKEAFSTANIGVYRNSGGTNRYLKIDTSTAGVARVLAFKTMSDINTGTVQTPTSAQLSGGMYMYASNTSDATARPWLIAADSKRFFMWCGFSQTTAGGLVSSSYQHSYFYGDIVPYRGDDQCHFTLIGSGSAGSTSGCNFGNIVAGIVSTTAGHFVMGNSAQTDGSVPGGKVGDGLIGMSYMGATSGITYPDPVSGGMILAPVRVCDSSQLRGHLPGIWQPVHNLPANPGDTFSGTGELSGKTFLLLDTSAGGPTRCRLVLETSDTWS